MATVDVLDWNKKKVGQAELDEGVFASDVRKDILHSVVRWQLACRRQGTAKTKEKGEVRGGGKKPFKQKGTGNARQGSTRSPLLRGGGTIFGPKPRDYSYTLPKKIKQIGLRSALSHLNKEGRLFVVDSMVSPDGKTKELMQRMKGFGSSKAILISAETDQGFKRAAANNKSVLYCAVEGMNVYDLLKYDTAIVTKEAIAEIQARCGVVK